MRDNEDIGRRAFTVSDWASYVRFRDSNKSWDDGVRYDADDEIIENKAIDVVDEIHIISYGSRGEKRIIEDGVWFLSWDRAKAWGDRHAEGDSWRVESLSRIDPDLDLEHE